MVAGGGGCTVYVIATLDSTTISVDGTTRILNIGDFYSSSIISGTRITRDKPVCVVVMRKGSNDYFYFFHKFYIYIVYLP